MKRLYIILTFQKALSMVQKFGFCPRETAYFLRKNQEKQKLPSEGLFVWVIFWVRNKLKNLIFGKNLGFLASLGK